MQTEEDIKKAVETLKTGGVVVFPTETAYGLAADATNAHAVSRLMAIKGRDGWKTPPLVAGSMTMAEKEIILSPQLKKLAERYWPGPLTIVTPIRTNTTLCQEVIREGTVAIRVSSHETARMLSVQLGAPIVATSANITGQATCYDVASIHVQFDTRLLQPDFYLDEGLLPHHIPSTIVTEQNGILIILRQGEIVL